MCVGVLCFVALRCVVCVVFVVVGCVLSCGVLVWIVLVLMLRYVSVVFVCFVLSL